MSVAATTMARTLWVRSVWAIWSTVRSMAATVSREAGGGLSIGRAASERVSATRCGSARSAEARPAAGLSARRLPMFMGKVRRSGCLRRTPSSLSYPPPSSPSVRA
jgi:hypothetical protein